MQHWCIQVNFNSLYFTDNIYMIIFKKTIKSLLTLGEHLIIYLILY
jgi:hypothetical protein